MACLARCGLTSLCFIDGVICLCDRAVFCRDSERVNGYSNYNFLHTWHFKGLKESRRRKSSLFPTAEAPLTHRDGGCSKLSVCSGETHKRLFWENPVCFKKKKLYIDTAFRWSCQCQSVLPFFTWLTEALLSFKEHNPSHTHLFSYLKEDRTSIVLI